MAKKQETTMEIVPTNGTVSSPLVIPADDIEEAVVMEETTEAPESHFIESNTQPITLEELSEKNIVPTFGDGTVSTSHQSFIESVLEAGRTVFGDLSPVDIRVSHPINGRVPSALHKKANELLEEDKTLYWQRIGFVSHVVGGWIVLVGTDVFIQRDKVTWRLFASLNLCCIVHTIIVVRPVSYL